MVCIIMLIKQLFFCLAECYLSQSRYQLIWFQGKVNTFHVLVGGNGAQFGKDGTACALVVSILNISRGVLSSNKNFLLLGANCKEDCVPISRFRKKVVSDVSEYGVSVDVTFVSLSYQITCKCCAFLKENCLTLIHTFPLSQMLVLQQ